MVHNVISFGRPAVLREIRSPVKEAAELSKIAEKGREDFPASRSSILSMLANWADLEIDQRQIRDASWTRSIHFRRLVGREEPRIGESRASAAAQRDR